MQRHEDETRQIWEDAVEKDARGDGESTDDQLLPSADVVRQRAGEERGQAGGVGEQPHEEPGLRFGAAFGEHLERNHRQEHEKRHEHAERKRPHDHERPGEKRLFGRGL